MFRFFLHNMMANATKDLAKGSFVVGLLLIGFGMLVFILRDLFALLAAGLFFLAGFSAIVYAIKLFWAMRKMTRRMPHDDDGYRENVDIHIEHHFEE